MYCLRKCTYKIELRDKLSKIEKSDTFFNSKSFDAKYERVQIDDIVNQLEHLNIQQKADIKQALREFTKIFDGTLGVYPHQKFYIELEPIAKPKHARPYPIPVIHLEAFKKE